MNKVFQWIRLFIIILIPCICLIAVNYIGDSANCFHMHANNQVAESILKGNTTYILGSPNGRYIKKTVIENMPKEIDTIVIGPSLSLCINKDNAGTNSFYNLSVEAANYHDILASFALLEINKIKYNRVILCADCDFYNMGRTALPQSRVFYPYADYMLSVIKGKTLINPEKQFKENLIKDKKHNLRQLFSVQYFQESIKTILQLIREKGNRVGLVTKENALRHFYFEDDASWVYEGSFIDRTEQFVKNDCINYTWDVFCAPDEHLEKSFKETFILLMNYFHQKNISVDIFFSPLAPTLYDSFDNNYRPLLHEAEVFINEYAQNHDIKIVGSYCPYDYGFTDADYYDARHIRREKLSVFDFR